MKKLIFLLFISTFTLFASSSELYLLPNDSKKLEEKIETLIKNSKKSIKIAMYNFSYKKIAKQLKKASNSGVEIVVLLDKDKVKSDDEIFKYLNKNNIKTKLSKDKLHTKLLVFDTKVALIGSINLTKKSFTQNYESVLLTSDKKVVEKIDRFITDF